MNLSPTIPATNSTQLLNKNKLHNKTTTKKNSIPLDFSNKKIAKKILIKKN